MKTFKTIARKLASSMTPIQGHLPDRFKIYLRLEASFFGVLKINKLSMFSGHHQCSTCSFLTVKARDSCVIRVFIGISEIRLAPLAPSAKNSWKILDHFSGALLHQKLSNMSFSCSEGSMKLLRMQDVRYQSFSNTQTVLGCQVKKFFGLRAPILTSNHSKQFNIH